MGTYFTTGATQADVVTEILDPLKRGHHLTEAKLIPYMDDEPVLWTVEKGDKDGVPYQFIGCYILRDDEEGNWGYKPMDETMGPCFYSVPLEWLDKYPCIVPNNAKGYSDKWRAKVRSARLATV